ncbi:hypothetical protein XM47_11750 [Catenovulum maritimum]|uniref:Uncharacterized protein n=1 Tax=Catenovulum maritimum TaxID=1513271 RepID=A0A0J8GU93_9ALTE|nr:hypothetical protein XM47_11750 [Catenovulum maritimum]
MPLIRSNVNYFRLKNKLKLASFKYRLIYFTFTWNKNSNLKLSSNNKHFKIKRNRYTRWRIFY